MEEDDSGLNQVDPQWLDTGGIPGTDPAYPPYGEDQQQWDTNPYTISDFPSEDFAPPGEAPCVIQAGEPPGSGTYVLGSIDGVCQWIDTTTCP